MKMMQLHSSKKLVIKTTQGFRFIPFQNIVCVVADNNYSKIRLSNQDELLVCKTLKFIEAKLESCDFIRCHKSYLVNMEYIEELLCNGVNKLKLSDRHEIPISRDGLKSIKQTLEI